MADKVHWKTAQKLAKEAESAVEGSVESVIESVEEYRVMDKRGDVVDYASSFKEAQEKVKEWGYIVKV